MFGTKKRQAGLRNLIAVDDERLSCLLDQLPTTWSILENAKAKFGISLKAAKFELESESLTNLTTIKRIRRLERYLERNNLINKSRPRRMPHAIVDGSQFWWVRESFLARKVIVPTPALLERFGIAALTVWISDPTRAPKPKHEWDWTGSFLYLPTTHYERGKTETCLSKCSALQFLVNAAQDKPLFTRDGDEPFGRWNYEHPITKLTKIGGFVSDERRLESLYYVRYLTNEQTYTNDGTKIRVNDLVGYPIYISAYPSVANRRNESQRPSSALPEIRISQAPT